MLSIGGRVSFSGGGTKYVLLDNGQLIKELHLPNIAACRILSFLESSRCSCSKQASHQPIRNCVHLPPPYTPPPPTTPKLTLCLSCPSVSAARVTPNLVAGLASVTFAACVVALGVKVRELFCLVESNYHEKIN